MALQLHGITKIYRGQQADVRAIDGVDLRIEPGTFVAVQGKSGCGKSTLLLVAGGLLAPDGGTVRLGDTQPYTLSAEGRARWRAAHVGFVFQQFHLVPYLNVLDNVLAPSLAIEIADARQRAESLIEQFGLSARRTHVPGKLSTGERQRTALARALLARPRLLLADEPTGNLDRENAVVVLDALAEFARGGGAVMMVTHDLAAAARADRVESMQSGRFAEAVALSTGK